jgi:hypothetical protein
MASLAEQEEEQRRKDAISEQKRIIAGHQMNLTKAQDRLQQLEADDFERRIASKPLDQLTVSERSEIISRLGLRRFEELLIRAHQR